MPSLRTRRRNWRRGLYLALLPLVLVASSSAGSAAQAAEPAHATLGAAVAGALSAAVDSGGEVSLAILGPGRGRLLAGASAGVRLAPGTAWSAVTAAAGLWRLGPSSTVETTVLGPRPRSHTILGSLVLVGGADPLLSAAEIAALAATVAARAKLVTGAILADGALVAYPEVPPGWPLGAALDDSEPPAAALAAAGDEVTLTVTPGKSPGIPATVAETPSGLLRVSGSVATVRAAKASAVAPTPAFAPDGAGVLVSGSIAVGADAVTDVLYPPDPARLAADLFRADLIHDGVTVQGSVGTGLPVAGNVRLAHVLSPPLSAWLPALWSVPSGAGAPSPLIAEDIYRLLCQPTRTAPCGVAADQKVVLRFLDAAGAAVGTSLSDGSGLSLTDDTSAQTLAQVLHVASLHAWGGALLQALPPLTDTLAGAPAGAQGVFSHDAGDLSLLAEVPAPGAATKAGDRIVAFLASGVLDPAMAVATARAVVDAAAGAKVAPPHGRGLDAAAAAPVLGGSDQSLLKALDGAGPGAETAVTAWTVGAKSPAVSLNGAALLPATGTVPLFVAAQALPGAVATTRLTTRLVVDGTLSGSTLNGSVGFVAGLDPTLSTVDLATLAEQVAALGVRQVTGGVVVDDLALPPTTPTTWPWQWLTDPPAAGGDALSVGEGLYSVAVLPGDRLGASPTVEVVPVSTPLGVTNEATTVSGRGQTLALWPDPQSGRMVLTGTIGMDDKLGAVFLRVAPDPAFAAAELLLQDLKADGVSVSGAIRRAAVPAVAPTLATSAGTTLLALDDSLLASPTPATAWDAAAIAGGALRGVSGVAAADAGVAATAGLLVHDGGGAPAPVLTEPVGVGQDDRIATYGCAEALANLAGSTGAQGQLPALLPVVPTPGLGGSLHAMVGVATGAGSLAGYFVPKTGPTVAICVSLAALSRSGTTALTETAAAAAALAARAAGPPAKPSGKP